MALWKVVNISAFILQAHVLSVKNVESLPFPMISMTFVCSALWLKPWIHKIYVEFFTVHNIGTLQERLDIISLQC